MIGKKRINTKFKPFKPLFKRLDELEAQGSDKDVIIVAVDGGSASGKTTLGQYLEKRYDLKVLHIDDFYLPKEKRTEERLSELGGNIDRERLINEVLMPLREGKQISYKAYSCVRGGFYDPVTVNLQKIMVIEGAYAMHPDFMKYYDFCVYLNIEKEKQFDRITKCTDRIDVIRYFTEWTVRERIYFEKTDIKNRCDLVINI